MTRRTFRPMTPLTTAALAAAAVLVATTFWSSPARAVPLNPLDFTSLGALPGGNVMFDTDALTFNGTLGGVDQPQAGGPNLAVFTFDTSTLASGDTITGMGSRPLVLLFQGSFTISGMIDVGGQNGGAATPFTNHLGMTVAGQFAGGAGGAGGPGGGSGGVGSGYVTVGMIDFVSIGSDGGGPGGGGRGSVSGASSGASGGGGGGFGGAGGDGGNAGVAPGGGPYGDLANAFEGGSGGGGGGGVCCNSGANAPGRGGGGGGGGIELGAVALIDFMGGKILVNGGISGIGGPGFQAGAGSGGAILLHAFDIGLDGNTMLLARGGNSTIASGAGCGGGGRITMVTNTQGAVSDAGATIDTSGGFRGCAVGAVLSLTDPNVGVAPPAGTPGQVPEPATLALFAFGLAGLGFLRRRSGAGAPRV